jgi:hypothetical protein
VLVNNVEAALGFSAGEQTSTERDGIAKLARLTQNGLDVELFHILTFT